MKSLEISDASLAIYRWLLLALVLIVFVVVVMGRVDRWQVGATAFAVIGTTFACGTAFALDIIKFPERLWHPFPWFMLTGAVYYGVGPALYYLGHLETVAYVELFYAVPPAALWRATEVSCIGMLLVTACYVYFMSGGPLRGMARTLSERAVFSGSHMERVALFFLVVGLPVKLFIVLPNALGLWDIILPGVLQVVSELSLVALVPLYDLRVARGKTSFYRLLFVAVAALEFVVAMATLSKLAVLKVIIVVVLAWARGGVSIRKLAIAGVTSVAFYALILVPVVLFGRIAVSANSLKSSAEGVEVVHDLADGTAATQLATLFPGVQSWWSRLDYAPAQTYAIEAYDAGYPGDTFELAVWTFVPRVLVPDKPIINTGMAFNERMTGRSNSLVAPGMYAEGYWNAGWPGLLLVCVSMAICFAGWERYTTWNLAANRYEVLPIAWMGLFPAIQQDSWFIPGTLGTVVICVALHFSLRWVLGERRQVFGGTADKVAS